MVLKDFGHGISMKTAQSVFDEYGPRMEVLADWKDLKDPSPAANLGTFNRSNQWIPRITRMNIPGKIAFHLGVAQGMVLQKNIPARDPKHCGRSKRIMFCNGGDGVS